MEYGPAPESRERAHQWLGDHEHRFSLYIDGAWQPAECNEYVESRNPATGEVLAKVSKGEKVDVDKAVAAAKKALPGWVSVGPTGRARYLYGIARQIQKHSRLFAVVETLDNGKTIRETRDIDVPLVVRHFYHHAGWAQLLNTDSELRNYREIGVIGQILPWNFPLMMLAWKIAPALAMGNTVVLKPAGFTPLTALLFAEICENVGLPAGVVNILTGNSNTGKEIVKHPDIQKIAFTGSTGVGQYIRREIAGSGKKLSLELGGKSPIIVFEDADLDSVVEGLVDAIYLNQGQVCCAGSRLIVQEGIADELIEKLKNRLENFRLGDPLDKTMDMGAIVDGSQLESVKELVNQGRAEGAAIWQPSWEVPTCGCFYPPTLITDVSPAHTVVQEEIFGPVLVAMTFRTPSEAVELANNTRFGLASSVWTENINLALDIAPKIKAGVVWTNCHNVFDAAAGFGGYRESGFGREGGREGLFEYVKPAWENDLETLEEARPGKKEEQKKSGVLGKVATIDRTAKHYIGGKQVRPDGGGSRLAVDAEGTRITEIADGNRKDIRNAVEAAAKAGGWAGMTGHGRAQVLYFIAENLEARTDEFSRRVVQLNGCTKAEADREIQLCLERIFVYAAYADKYEGRVHHTLQRNITIAMPEALGILGIVCPEEASFIGFISTVIPAIAMGNSVVVVPSERYALLATDFYQVLETSDVPGGVVNIVTGKQEILAKVLACHNNLDGLWYFGTKEGSKIVEYEAAEDMKRTWVHFGKVYNWYDPVQGVGEHFLRQATQIKNIWVPYGE